MTSEGYSVNVLIRPAAQTDLGEWLQMRLSLWPDHSADEHLPEMRDYLGHDELLILVAEDSGRKLVGFLEASVQDYAEGCQSARVGYIEGWYVDSNFRMKGVGRLLVQEAESWARAKGFTEMASDCELGNAVSLAAHLKLGYEEASRLIHFKKKL